MDKNNIGLALFTYCRPEHTRRVLASLDFNHFSHIYIFQDGLKDLKDRTEWELVNKIIKEFANDKASVYVSDRNKGLANSIVEGMNYVFDRHNCAIALEDDIILGKGYSEFMTEAFEEYEDVNKVSCIAGCGMPVDIPESYPYDVYFSYRMSSAAWGTWKDRWERYKRDFALVKEIMIDPEAKEIFSKCGGDLKSIIEGQLYGKLDSWAIFWCLLQIKEKSVCAMPVKYLAQDIGHDGKKGTNSVFFSTRYDTKLYDFDSSRETSFPSEIVVESEIQNQIKEIYDISDSERIRSYQIYLYKKWISYHNNGGKLLEKIENFQSDIWIYGDGGTAQLLLEELRSVPVRGIIVKDKKINKMQDTPVYRISELAHQDGICVVTPVYDYAYIKKDISHIFNNEKIISIERLLSEEDE